MADDTELLWIKSTVPTQPDGGDKVVLSETDPRHPGAGNLAWVAGPNPVQVARTAEVDRVIREGNAAIVSGPGDAGKSTPARSESKGATTTP